MIAQPVSVPLRFSDGDPIGHVNHATVLVLLGAGRGPVLREVGIRGQDYVVRRAEIDYVREVGLDAEAVQVTTRATELGRTSFTVQQELSVHGQSAVQARFVLVLWDSETRTTRPLTEGERAGLTALS